MTRKTWSYTSISAKSSASGSSHSTGALSILPPSSSSLANLGHGNTIFNPRTTCTKWTSSSNSLPPGASAPPSYSSGISALPSSVSFWHISAVLSQCTCKANGKRSSNDRCTLMVCRMMRIDQWLRVERRVSTLLGDRVVWKDSLGNGSKCVPARLLSLQRKRCQES